MACGPACGGRAAQRLSPPLTPGAVPRSGAALDAIGDGDEPRHVARFDAQGVLAGSRDASRCIGYANEPGKPVTLAAAGATTIVSSLAEIVLALRARPLPN